MLVHPSRPIMLLIYLRNLPIGAVCVLVLVVFLDIHVKDASSYQLPIKTKLRRLDLPGTVVFVGAVVCLLLALQEGGQEYAFNSAMIIGLFTGAGCLFIVFLLIQWNGGDRALLPIRVLGQRSILAGFFTILLLGAANTVTCFYIPFYFQGVQGVDPIMSAVRFIAYFLPLMAAVGIAGALVSRWGYYIPYMLAGEVVAIVGTVFLTHLQRDTSTA